MLLGGVASSHDKVQRPLPEYELLQVQASCRTSRLGKPKFAMSASQIVGKNCFQSYQLILVTVYMSHCGHRWCIAMALEPCGHPWIAGKHQWSQSQRCLILNAAWLTELLTLRHLMSLF